jgi:hypothetical protein
MRMPPPHTHRHDINKDGKIDSAELHLFCAFLEEDFDSRGRVQVQIGQRFDSDLSGALSEEEWRGFIAMEVRRDVHCSATLPLSVSTHVPVLPVVCVSTHVPVP